MLRKSMHGKPLIYFDTAATAQKPQVVIDAMTDFYTNRYATVHRAIYELSVYSTKEYVEVRHKIKELLNAAHVEEIIFTRGTTESVNFIAQSFGKAFIEPDDEIIISETEHHSNIVPWQMMCQERDAVLRVVPVDDEGELMLDVYAEMLSDRTKLVSIAHIANSIGTVNPIKEMIRMAHSVGAKFLVDGAQSAPHMLVDVQDLDADFYVFSGHKMYGPTGVGVLYGKESLLKAMPPSQGGGDMIENVTFEETTYNVLPLKFEAGTPMIAEVIGLGAAIDYVKTIGLEAIAEWEQKLLKHATKRIVEVEGLRVIGNATEKGAIISFVVEGIHPLDIGTMLDLQGIAMRTGHHCAQPTMTRFGVSATARVSFGLYNTMEEVDVFVEALQRVVGMLRG